MMKLLNSLTLLTLLITLTSCLDELPELGNENYCPGSRLEDGTCPSAKSKSLGWDFSNASNYSYNSNYVEVSSGRANLKAIDTNFSGSDFSSGSHVGTYLDGNNKLILRTKPSDIGTHINSILPDRSSALIGYWRFDGQLNDSTNNLNNGSYVNGASLSSSSKLGSGAINLNGIDEYIDIGDIDEVENLTSMSACSWVKHNSIANDDYIFSKFVGSNGFLLLRDDQGASTGRIDTYTLLVADGNDYARIEAKSNSSVVGVWTHLCFTFQANSTTGLRLYVNGEEDENSPVSTALVDNTSNTNKSLRFGTSSSATSMLDGMVDEVFIYSTVLSSQEIRDIYKNQNSNFSELSSDWTPHWDNIVGYWKMDGNWQDSSGNENDGIIGAGTPSFSNGKIGNLSGEFSGSSITLPPTFTAVDMKDRTLNIWVKPSSFSGIRSLIDKDNGNCGWGYWISGSGKLMHWTKAHNDYVDGGLPLELDTWQMVTVVYDYLDKVTSFYINSKLNSTIHKSSADECSSSGINGYIGTYRNNSLGQFSGALDDVAMWGRKLTIAEIQNVYNRQKQKYAASYQSPVIDLASSQNILNLTSITDLPFMKELTNTTESSSDYTSLSGDLSDGLVGYWPLNETIADSISGDDFEDFSSAANHGVASAGATMGALGLLGRAVELDGVDDSILLPASNSILSGDTSFTMSIWFKTESLHDTVSNVGGGRLITLHRNSGSASSKIGMGTYGDNTDTLMIFYTRDTGSQSTLLKTNTSYNNGKWHQMVTTYDHIDNTLNMYYDGSLVASQGSLTLAGTGSFPARIGAFEFASNVFNGVVDEAAIWNRELSATEIQELYRRGANRIKYQVRICSDSTCSTDPEWKGPGADGTTYFSELYNRAAVDLDSMFSSCFSVVPDVCDNTEFNFLGATLADNSSYRFSDFPMQNLNTRYFQYRVLMEAEENTACGGEPCLPSVSAITFETEHDYYASSPSITSSSPISITGRIRKAEHQVSGDCTVKYQFSKDGTNFSYYNSGSWISATDNASQANTIDQISSTLKDYITSGSLYLRAYLASDGSQSCSLNSFKITHDD